MLGLPPLAKFEILEVLRADLRAGLDEDSEEHRQLKRQQEALQALGTVAEHLDLGDGETPTPQQFDVVAKDLGCRSPLRRLARGEFQALGKPVEPLRHLLVARAGECLGAGVDLDATVPRLLQAEPTPHIHFLSDETTTRT